MSIAHYSARQRSALIQHEPSTPHTQPFRQTISTLAGAAFAMVPAAFWASVVWFVWGRLGAVIAAIVVLVASTFTMRLLRVASEIKTPDPARRPAVWRQAA